MNHDSAMEGPGYLVRRGRAAATWTLRRRWLQAAIRPLARRGLARPLWRRNRVDRTFRVNVKMEGTSFRYRSTPGDFIGRSLYWRDLAEWEAEVIDRFMSEITSARGFLDVGANTGVYTLIGHALNPDLRSYAFEPVPTNMERLREHLLINGFGESVTTVQAAVSDASGRTTFGMEDGDSPTVGRILDGSAAADHPIPVSQTIEVELCRLDERVPPDFPVDVMKIDVEGAELAALRGGLDTIRRHRPRIFIELLDEATDVRQLLRDLGYTVDRIDDRNFLCRPGRPSEDPPGARARASG